MFNQLRHGPTRFGCFALGLVFLTIASGCVTKQAGYSSPQQATDALIAALDPVYDTDAFEVVFGPGSDDMVSFGDDVYVRENARRFVAEYRQQHAFEEADDGYTYLVIGTDEWPFPIPLTEESGTWYFDTDAGRDELINRRIGHNELDTIQTCLAIVDAQLEYAMLDLDADGMRKYATRFRSSPGERDGLYWPTGPDESPSPLGEIAVQAAAEGYDLDQAPDQAERVYHGYRFQILTRQGPDAEGGEFEYMIDGRLVGGFAVVAWPATYGKSGIMTFIVSHHGIVYDKDLGPETESIARDMSRFNPDETWVRVNDAPFEH